MAHWRYTGHTPKIGPFDAMALFPLALFVLWWRLWTLIVALLGVAVFMFLSRRGINSLTAMRIARSWLAGRVRPAQRPGMAARRVVQGLRWDTVYDRREPRTSPRVRASATRTGADHRGTAPPGP